MYFNSLIWAQWRADEVPMRSQSSVIVPCRPPQVILYTYTMNFAYTSLAIDKPCTVCTCIFAFTSTYILISKVYVHCVVKHKEQTH